MTQMVSILSISLLSTAFMIVHRDPPEVAALGHLLQADAVFVGVLQNKQQNAISVERNTASGKRTTYYERGELVVEEHLHGPRQKSYWIYWDELEGIETSSDPRANRRYQNGERAVWFVSNRSSRGYQFELMRPDLADHVKNVIARADSLGLLGDTVDNEKVLMLFDQLRREYSAAH